MPRPGAPLIHRNWEAHHRPVPEKAATATGYILRHDGTPGDWNPETGDVDDFPGQRIWAGNARIQQSSGAREAEAAGQQVTTHTYLVVVPHDVPLVRVDDYGDWWVTTAASDPYLIGRPLRIVDVLLGSLRWERDLICRDDLTSHNP